MAEKKSQPGEPSLIVPGWVLAERNLFVVASLLCRYGDELAE